MRLRVWTRGVIGGRHGKGDLECRLQDLGQRMVTGFQEATDGSRSGKVQRSRG